MHLSIVGRLDFWENSLALVLDISNVSAGVSVVSDSLETTVGKVDEVGSCCGQAWNGTLYLGCIFQLSKAKIVKIFYFADG